MQGGQPLACMVRDFITRLVLRLPVTTGCAFAVVCTAFCFDAAPLATTFCTCVKTECASKLQLQPRHVIAAWLGKAEHKQHTERERPSAIAVALGLICSHIQVASARCAQDDPTPASDPPRLAV